jgi:hypothetical protein
MRAVVVGAVLAGVVGCGAPGQPSVPSAPIEAPALTPATPIAPRPLPPGTPVEPSVEDLAVRFMRAVAACDRPAALGDTIVYEDLTAMTTKEIDRKEIEDAVVEFLDERCRELGEAHAKIVSARVEETKSLRASEEGHLKRDVEVKMIKITFEHDGKAEERGNALVFFKTDRGWKFSPKH